MIQAVMAAALLLAASPEAKLTAGEIALLVTEPDSPAVLTHITSGLESSDPLVRATAARVAFVRGLAVLPAVRQALEAEKDMAAALEEARALILLTDEADEATLDLLEKAGVLGPTARLLAEVNGPALAGHPRIATILDRPRRNGFDAPADVRVLRTLSGLPPGLAREVMGAAGCEPKGMTFGVLDVTYDRFRRAHNVTVGPGQGSEACARAMTIMVALDVAPTAPSDAPESIVVRLDQGAAECALAPTGPTAADGGYKTPPRKVKGDPPRFSARAKDLRIQGTVILGGIIDTSGCVVSLRLFRSAHPLLDVEVVAAVAAWRYAPLPAPIDTTMHVKVSLN